MKLIIKIFFILTLIISPTQLISDTPFFLDFKYILNESDAGKKAQKFLKNRLEKGLKSIKEKELNIQEQEKKIIQQKKVLSVDEYKKKVQNLRSQVSSLQKERNDLLETVAKQRSKARSELLKNLNPLIKEYMNEKKIRMVVDKKSLLLADENLDITEEIIARLNKKLKSIKF